MDRRPDGALPGLDPGPARLFRGVDLARHAGVEA